MVRSLIILLLCSISITIEAQTPFRNSFIQVTPWSHADHFSRLNDSNNSNKLWFFSNYAGIGSSFIFSNGGSGTVFSVPVGIQLNRRLNNNIYAFAGISAAPVFFNFNHSFNASPLNSMYPHTIFPASNNYGIFTRAEMGLMYINNDKTFSISGSIGVERNSFPVYPVNRTNSKKQ